MNDELERESGEFGFGQNQQNPVYNKQQRSGPIEVKHVSEHSGKIFNPLGRFTIRPSGWLQRATLNTVSEIQPEAQVGWNFKGFPDSESSKI